MNVFYLCLHSEPEPQLHCCPRTEGGVIRCKRYQSLIFYSFYISLFFTVRTHNLGVEIAILQERLRKLNKNFVGNKRRCCKVEKVHCIRIGHSGLKG